MLRISISNSEKIIESLSAIEYARSNSSCKTITIVYVKKSSTEKVSMLGFYTDDGVEICVASAKAFTTQLTILASIVFCKNEIILQKLHNIPDSL